MTDDKCGQPSNELSVGVTSDLTYGCPHLSKESLGANNPKTAKLPLLSQPRKGLLSPVPQILFDRHRCPAKSRNKDGQPCTTQI